VLTLSIALYVRALVLGRHLAERLRARLRSDKGQASTEYALVLLGAASIALLVAVWARKSDSVGKLLDAVFAQITKMMS